MHLPADREVTTVMATHHDLLAEFPMHSIRSDPDDGTVWTVTGITSGHVVCIETVDATGWHWRLIEPDDLRAWAVTP